MIYSVHRPVSFAGVVEPIPGLLLHDSTLFCKQIAQTANSYQNCVYHKHHQDILRTSNDVYGSAGHSYSKVATFEKYVCVGVANAVDLARSQSTQN